MEFKELDNFVVTYYLKETITHLEDIASKGFFWDLVVPLLVAGLVAYISAILTFRFARKSNNELLQQQQEHFETTQKITRENSKRELINHTTLAANKCIGEIISIKDNYRQKLEPSQSLSERILKVPTIAGFDSTPTDLSFIDKLTFLVPSDPDDTSKWKQPTNIHILFSNYNNMRRLWESRNELREELNTHIKNTQDYQNFISFDSSNPVPNVLFDRLTQTTEYLIRLTDDLGYQFHKFLVEFESSYEDSIDDNLDKSLLHKILKFPLSHNSERLKYLAHSLPPSTASLTQVFKTHIGVKLFKQSIRSPYDI